MEIRDFRRSAAFAIALYALNAHNAHAQEDSTSAALTLTPAPTRAVVAGEHYRAGGVHRFLFGADYRALWVTPLAVPELDMRTFAGGLKPVRRVGGQQTHGLAMKGADGRDYTFRGLDKDPTEILPPEYHGTFIDDLLQDQISSSLPGGAVAVPPLLRAAGVLHAEPVLVVLPDDSLLGEYRSDYRGLLGTFEVYPRPVGDGNPGSFGAAEIISGEELWKRMDEDPSTRPDSRAFLTARLVDILIGDWDRHRGQWRWAKLSGNPLWKPIPEDRDQAFVRFEGLFIAAGRVHLPQFVSFEDEYPGIEGLTWNGRDGDRRILVDLEKRVWDEVARDLQTRITDDVIAEAVTRFPPEYRAVEGATIEKNLRARRDALPEVADRFYRFLAKDVDIHASNRDDVASVTFHEDGAVQVILITRENAPTTFYQRTFHEGETDEVRIYLGAGDDRVRARGKSGDIVVRVIGGGGSDSVEVHDESEGTRLRVSDSDRVTWIPDRGVDVDTRPYTPPVRETAPWIPPRDWGRRYSWYPWIGGSSDLGALFLVGIQSQGYGFRKDPYANEHTLRIGYATGAGGFGGDYNGEFRFENSRAYAGMYLRASGLDFLNFYGFGNETDDPGDEDFYELKQSQYRIEPSLTFPLKGSLFATLRANAIYNKTKLEPNRFISVNPPYGAEDFLQFGAGAGVEIDTRDSDMAPTRGARLVVDGTVFPEGADVETVFGHVHGEASIHLPIHILSTPSLALRAGGKKVWGTYPYHEAAYVGGVRTVRGFAQHRFAGDASAYGNVELRVPLGRVYFIVPTTVGLFALGDVGRVFLEGETSDKWHTGVGGGVWASFLGPANTGSISVASSDEGTRVYVVAGLAF